jgi:hypothetical protein
LPFAATAYIYARIAQRLRTCGKEIRHYPNRGP